MKKSRVYVIKKEQKKAALFREVSQLLRDLSEQEASLVSIFVSRVELSADGGICSVYLTALTNQESVERAIETLKLYRGSMRKALANKSTSRYVPELVFYYDKIKEKEQRVQELIDKVCEDLPKENAEHADDEA